METNESCVPESLKRVTITAATYIYPEAFYGCENIESIGLPNTLTWIGGSAFENCSSLTSIVVPDSIESIGKFAFRGCNSLEKITIPFVGGKQDENEYFGYIFGADSFVPSSLKEIVITNETAIKEYAFYNLSEIESIVFTHEISSIDKGAFEGCSGLSDVWYGGTKAQAGSIIIGNENDYLINAVWHYESCLTKESHNYDYTCDVSCDICGYVREVEADAHIFGEWIITIEPTVSREGERIRQCENCDFAEIEMLEKLPEDKPIEYPNPFKDIKKGKWYTEAVLWCNYFGYMNGVSETMFGYKHNVTRAMFATILAKIDGSEISGYNEMSFTDVKAGQWYSNAIEWAYQNGYAAGLGDGYFGRKENVSREQIALFFYTYSSKNGIDVSEQAKLNGYTDLGKVHSWALDAVKWAVAKGLISGTSETTLSPRDSATRAEIALIIKNYVENIVNGTNNPSFTGKWVGTKYNNDSLAGYNAPIPELTITYNSDGSYSIFAKWDSQDVADSYFWYFEGVYDEEKSGIVYTGYHEKTVYDPITDDSGIERVYNNGSGIISIQNGELKFNPTNNDRTLELITFEITDAVI